MKPPDTVDDRYQLRLLTCLPVYSTRLVRESAVPFSGRCRARSPAEVAPLLMRYFADKDREELVAVLLDTALTVTGLARISVGGLQSAVVEPAQVLKAAILANASSLILAHNHPSGNLEPSREDVVITKRVAKAGKLFDIPVRDHLIVTHDGFTSLAERGLMG